MLLKIVRINSQQKWWMFDNIRKVSISNPFSRSGITDQDYDVILFDIEKTCSCSGPGEACSDCNQYIVAICRLNDGSEISIAFDTTAYLLNDDGKTIEKIVSSNITVKNDPPKKCACS